MDIACFKVLKINVDPVHFCGKLNFLILIQDCHVSSKLEEELLVSTIPHIEGGTIRVLPDKKVDSNFHAALV